EPENGRHRDRQCRQRAKGIFDAGDRGEIESDQAPQLRLGEDGDAAHRVPLPVPEAMPAEFRQMMSRWACMSMLRPDSSVTTGPSAFTLPASNAAMPTAPAPSTTSRSAA